MNVIAIKDLVLAILIEFGGVALTVLTAVIGIAIAFYIYRWGLGVTFTNWPWLDRATYTPYKGYKSGDRGDYPKRTT